MRFPVAILCAVLLLLPACSGKQALLPLAKDEDAADRPKIIDPAGPIPGPTLPPDLATAGRTTQPAAKGDGLPYTVSCEVRPGRKDEAPVPEAVAADILSVFEGGSTLHRLQDKLPESVTGLEQRLGAALDEGRALLHSRGFYAGRVFGRIVDGTPDDKGRRTAVARVVFMPGPQYTIDRTVVIAPVTPLMDEQGSKAQQALPKTLADVGLAKGAPAVADDVVAATERALEVFLDNGYPHAAIAGTKYVVDRQKRVLEAELRIAPGAFVRMGDVLVSGDTTLRPSYFKNMRLWRPGRPWRQRRIESLRDLLRQTGLFQSITIKPSGEEDADGIQNVMLMLTPAPERTISGEVKYHSDFGPGVQLNWEHRNLTGRADSLRLSMPLWTDMQEITAAYRLPYFLTRSQDFVANAGALNQDTDAYRISSAAVSAGIERRLSRYWRGAVKVSLEGGNIKEPDKKEQDYMMAGLPLSLTFDNTGSLMNAVRGTRMILSLTPYTGEYEGNFSILRSRLEGRFFLPLAGEDTLVLALRGVVGAIAGEDSDKVPPSVRFYSGGGGSVRGYEYQSIGPRNDKKDPLGGGSLAEVSAETRWKVGESWGLVAFVDGGTVYENLFDSPTETMRWGAGVGFRYYTPIGPVRFDVAVPLNPRKDDDSMQLYISIGQSF